MRLITRITTATTSRTWMRPPIEYEVIIPRAQRTRRITKIVQSMVFPSFREDQPRRSTTLGGSPGQITTHSPCQRAVRGHGDRTASSPGAARVRGFARPHRSGGSAAASARGRDRASGPEPRVDQGVLASHGPGVELERWPLDRAAAPPRQLDRPPLSEGEGRHSIHPRTLVAREGHLQLIRLRVRALPLAVDVVSAAPPA